MKKLLLGSLLLAFMGCTALANAEASSVITNHELKDETAQKEVDYLKFDRKIVDHHFAKPYIIGTQAGDVILIPKNVIESVQDNEDGTYNVLTEKGYEYENVNILGLSYIKIFRAMGD